MADRWVTQTKFYDPSQPPEVCTGNCTEAAFSSLLGLRLDEVPSFQGLASSAYWNAVHEFAESKGFALVMNQRKEHYPGLYLADGPSVRGCGHFVVMHDGHMVHDPHPSRSGITEIERTWVLVPMDPAATQPPAVGVDVSDEIADLRAEVEVLRRAVHTGISVIVESCSPRGNPDIDDASEIAAALHDMRAVLPDPLSDLRTDGGSANG